MVQYILRNILVIVILCVAVLFISGIVLPRYFSKQYFELRSELKDHNKELSSVNSIPVSEAIGGKRNLTLNISSSVVENIQNSTDWHFTGLKRRKGQRLARGNRSKRQAQYENAKLYSWNFNLNISRYENVTDQIPLKGENDKHNFSTKDKSYLGMAIYMAGNGTKRTYRELESAWGSVGAFIRSIFGDEVANLKPQTNGVTEQTLSINGSIETDPGIDIQNPDIEFNIGGSGDEPLKTKARGGRFIFGFLGFRSKPQTTTEFPIHVETTVPSATPDIDQAEKNIFRNEDSDTMVWVKSELVTELPNKIGGIQSDSLVHNHSVFIHNHSVADGFTDNTEKISSESLNSSETLIPSNMSECDDCQNDILEVPTSVSQEESISSTTLHRNVMFSDKILEIFCMNLVSQLEDFQRFLPNVSNSFGMEQDLGNPTQDNLNTPDNIQPFDFSRLNLSLEKNLSDFDPDIVDDSFFESSESPSNTAESVNERERRFFNLNIGLGSGRSALDDTIDLSSEDEISATTEIEGTPSISDCDSYFRKKQNMFPKPTLMDMIKDPNIKLDDFANATMSPKLRDKHLQFLTDLLKNLSISLENQVVTATRDPIIHGNENAHSGSTGFYLDQIESSITEQSIKENATVTITVHSNKIESAETSNNADPTTETQRDGRFFNFFGFDFGSGSETIGSVEKDDNLHSVSTGFSLDRTESIVKQSIVENATVSITVNSSKMESSEGSRNTDPTTETQRDGRFFNFLGFDFGSGAETIGSVEKDENLHSASTSFSLDQTESIVKQSTTENATVSITVNSSKIESSEANSLDPTTETRRDGRFFNIFGFNFGSGNGESETVAPVEKDERFSPESERSLVQISESVTGSDVNIPENGDIFQDSFSGYYREGSDDNLLEFNATSSSHDGRFLSIFGLEGSGNGRQFEDQGYVQTEIYPLIEDEHEDDCLPDVAGQSHRCSNDGFENPLSHTSTTESSEIECQDDCSDFSNSYDRVVSENVSKSEENTEKNSSEVDNSVVVSNIYAGSEDSNGSEAVPTEKARLFFETIFLTGSGDGSLMEDSGGLINLIEEGTVKPPGRSSRRRGRLLDDLPSEETRTESGDYVYPQTVKNSEPHILLSKTDDFNIKEISGTVNYFQDTTEVYGKFPRRRGRLDSFPVHESNDLGTSNNTGNLATNFDSFSVTHPDKRSTVDVTIPSVLSSSTSDFSIIFQTPANLQPKFCNSASQCNAELNERCVRGGTSMICDCRKPLVRHKETRKCVAKVSLDVSVKFPNEEFVEDHKDPESSRFKQTRNHSMNTMYMLLKDAPDLIPIIVGVDVARFSPGSLIVSWNIVLAADNESESVLIKYVENDLKNALKKDSLIKHFPLNVMNASVMAISSMDPCMSSELNYCSKNAHCVRNGAFPGGYNCRCRDDQFDASSNKMFLGEVCEAFCPPNYCGENGHCEAPEGEARQCLCRGWYFGNHCEISGVVMVATFSANLGLIVLVIFLAVVCRGRCRKRTYGGTQFQRSEEVGMNSMRNGPSNIIALESNAGPRVTKFVNISTPLPLPPTIKLTRPTLNDSSISFDDSTFDMTPSSDGQLQTSMYQEVPMTT